MTFLTTFDNLLSMVIIYFLVALYLIYGFLYALYIGIMGVDPWRYFLINMLLGPIIFTINYIKYRRGTLKME